MVGGPLSGYEDVFTLTPTKGMLILLMNFQFFIKKESSYHC